MNLDQYTFNEIEELIIFGGLECSSLWIQGPSHMDLKVLLCLNEI